MKEFTTSAIFGSASSKELQLQFVGAMFPFPVNSSNLGDAWLPVVGNLISRTEYAELWKWVQATQSTNLITDAAWTAAKGASPIGACTSYSTGDGSTTFRIPDLGTQNVVLMDIGSSNSPAAGTIQEGANKVSQSGTGSSQAANYVRYYLYTGIDPEARIYGNIELYRNEAESAANRAEVAAEALESVGTAAYRDVQTSPSDKTAGRLLPVGAFGLGTYFQAFQLPAIPDHNVVVIGLIDVTNTYSGRYSAVDCNISIGRSNGVEPPVLLKVSGQKAYNTADAFMKIQVLPNNGSTADITGIRACLFTYNGVRYAGVRLYTSATGKDVNIISGTMNGNVVPFIVPYFNQSTSAVLNSEISGSLNQVQNSAGKIYDQTNIVGTVAHNLGSPTGAIIQRGSNPNGEFTIYADGTLKCWAPLVSTGNVQSWNFPTSFVAGIVICYGNNGGNAGNNCLVSFSPPSPTSVNVALLSAHLNSYAVAGISFGCSAIGRWFN